MELWVSLNPSLFELSFWQVPKKLQHRGQRRFVDCSKMWTLYYIYFVWETTNQPLKRCHFCRWTKLCRFDHHQNKFDVFLLLLWQSSERPSFDRLQENPFLSILQFPSESRAELQLHCLYQLNWNQIQNSSSMSFVWWRTKDLLRIWS